MQAKRSCPQQYAKQHVERTHCYHVRLGPVMSKRRLQYQANQRVRLHQHKNTHTLRHVLSNILILELMYYEELTCGDIQTITYSALTIQCVDDKYVNMDQLVLCTNHGRRPARQYR